MYFNIDMGCCGLAELHGIQNWQDLKECKEDYTRWMKKVYRAWMDTNGETDDGDQLDGCPQVVFTAVVEGSGYDHTAGDKLMTFIRKHRLGTVQKSKPRENPNSGNMVAGYLWSVDARKFSKWYTKNT